MSITLNPIYPWPIVAIFAGIVLFLTIWAYRQKFRGTTGGWRWVAFGLRIAAVILCLLAALRPSLMIDEKSKQKTSVIFLIDDSKSMLLNDEVGNQTRWSVARKAFDAAIESVIGKSKDLEVLAYRFDTDIHDYKADDPKEPAGPGTSLGSMMLKPTKDAQGKRIASIVLISDGASNVGTSPLVAAAQLRSLQIPVVTVGVGSPDAGKGSRDIIAKDLVAGPTVFVKNRPEIRATVAVRGYAGQTIEVELYVDKDTKPIDTKSIKVPEGAEILPITGLKYIPDTPGEKRLTIKVKPMAGELVKTNNEISTYLDVLKGGLNVLYVQGRDFSWDTRFLVPALDPAREIHADLKVAREPARGDKGLLDDADFAPGQYDVFILSGIGAEFLTRTQIGLLSRSVEKGAGLIMLGGPGSFGDGGWGNTELARILPVNVGPADGQIEFGDEGRKVVPNLTGLENYVLRLASTPAESAKIWASLPTIMGMNRFGTPKPSAILWASAGRDPVMYALDDTGKGRVIAFGGETWHWARSFEEESRQAYARFWRQCILWLARRENKGEDQVKLKLDARRVAAGQKLELTATARDGKNEPIADAQLEATVVRLDDAGKAEGKSEPIPLYPQSDESKGAYFANAAPGEYLATVKGTRGGKEIGVDRARFMVYQDDRELENPAADLDLLKQIAEITGGVSLKSEELAKHLKTLGPEPSEYISQTEKKLWDNWPFFLVFATLLTLEWALRKSKGWV